MRLKITLLTVGLLALSAAAQAQDAPAAPQAPARPAVERPMGKMNAPANADKMNERREMKFEEHKAHALQRIGAHIAEMQQRQSCVQAAATPDALKSCFPRMMQGGAGHEGGAMMMDDGAHMGGPKRTGEGGARMRPEPQPHVPQEGPPPGLPPQAGESGK